MLILCQLTDRCLLAKRPLRLILQIAGSSYRRALLPNNGFCDIRSLLWYCSCGRVTVGYALGSMNVSVKQVVEFVWSLRGMTRPQLVHLLGAMLASFILTLSGYYPSVDRNAVLVALAAAFTAGSGYVAALAQKPTIGKHAVPPAVQVDEAGRTHL